MNESLIYPPSVNRFPLYDLLSRHKANSCSWLGADPLPERTFALFSFPLLPFTHLQMKLRAVDADVVF